MLYLFNFEFGLPLLLVELFLIDGAQLLKDAYLDLWVFLFSIFLVQSQQFKLKLIDVAIIYKFALLVVYRKLFSYQLSILNVEVSCRWLLALFWSSFSFHCFMTLLCHFIVSIACLSSRCRLRRLLLLKFSFASNGALKGSFGCLMVNCTIVLFHLIRGAFHLKLLLFFMFVSFNFHCGIVSHRWLGLRDLLAIEIKKSIIRWSFALSIINDMDVILKLLNKLLSIYKGLRLLLCLVCRTLPNRRLRLPKHSHPWCGNGMRFILKLQIVSRLTANAEPFSWMCFLIFTLCDPPLALVINLAHLFLLLF